MVNASSLPACICDTSKGSLYKDSVDKLLLRRFGSVSV
jgi:hypothetical protein